MKLSDKLKARQCGGCRTRVVTRAEFIEWIADAEELERRSAHDRGHRMSEVERIVREAADRADAPEPKSKSRTPLSERIRVSARKVPLSGDPEYIRETMEAYADEVAALEQERENFEWGRDTALRHANEALAEVERLRAAIREETTHLQAILDVWPNLPQSREDEIQRVANRLRALTKPEGE